jgi:sec-independent protein translocase protein TatA
LLDGDDNVTVAAAALAEILGPDLLVILAIVALLFGGTQLPKLARSLGTARREFEAGVRGGTADAGAAPAPPEQTPPATPVMSKDEVARLLDGENPKTA